MQAIFGNQGPRKRSLVCDVVPSDAKPRRSNVLVSTIEQENKYPEYKLLFIMSERNDSKVTEIINPQYREKSNVLIDTFKIVTPKKHIRRK